MNIILLGNSTVKSGRNPDFGPAAASSRTTSEPLLGNSTAKSGRNPDFGPTSYSITISRPLINLFIEIDLK